MRIMFGIILTTALCAACIAGAFATTTINCYQSLVPLYPTLCVKTANRTKTIVTPTPSPTPIPTPTPTASPTPTPTVSPTPNSVYVYDGKQIYNGAAGAPDSIINADISNAPVDPNSATILAAQSASNVWPGASEATSLRPNIVGTPTPAPQPIATAQGGGHNPPINSGPAGGGAGWTTPWKGGAYYIEGTCTINCSSDAHVINFNPYAATVIEGGGWNWDGTKLYAFDGYVDSTDMSYCSQIGNKGDNATVSGVPLLGWTLAGNDLLAALSGTPINHPTGLIVAVSSVASGTAGVNYSTLPSNSVGTCTGGTTQCMAFGDILRLKANVVCPTDSIANAVCVSWKKYGAVVTDLGAIPIPRYMLDDNGKDDTDAALLTWQHSLTLSANFDIVQRGSVHC